MQTAPANLGNAVYEREKASVAGSTMKFSAIKKWRSLRDYGPDRPNYPYLDRWHTLKDRF